MPGTRGAGKPGRTAVGIAARPAVGSRSDGPLAQVLAPRERVFFDLFDAAAQDGLRGPRVLEEILCPRERVAKAITQRSG